MPQSIVNRGVTRARKKGVPTSAFAAQVTLSNPAGSASPAATALAIGHPFAAGAIPPGTRPAASWAGSAVPVQVAAASSWPDGSTRFARLLVALPAVAAGASGTLSLSAEAGSPSATIPGGKTAAQVKADLATNFPFTVTAANLKKGLEGDNQATDGSGAWTWSASTQLALFGTTDSRSRVRCSAIEAGPLAVTFHCWGPFLDNTGGASHPHLVVRAWYRCWLAAGGTIDRVEYLHSLEQGWTGDLAGGTTNADLQVGDFAVKLSGAAVAGRSWTGVRVPHHSSHALTAIDGTGTSASPHTAGSDWTANAPGLAVAHDPAAFVASGLVLPYDLAYFASTPVSPATDTAPATYAPGAQSGATQTCGRMTRLINNVGERQDIGDIPEWSARSLLTGHATYKRSDVATALYAAQMPINTRNPATGLLPAAIAATAWDGPTHGLGANLDTIWYLDTRSSGYSYVASPVGGAADYDPANRFGGWVPEFNSTHVPAPAYLAYLQTGAPWLLEALKQYGHHFPVIGQNYFAAPLSDGSTLRPAWICISQEERREAWAWKVLGQALSVVPDGDAEGAYLRAHHDRNDAAVAAVIAAGSANFRALGHWTFPFDPGGGGSAYFGSPWMQDYVFLARAQERRRLGSSTGLDAFLSHFWKSIRARAGGDVNQTCPWVAATYRMFVGYGGAGGGYFADWSRVPWSFAELSVDYDGAAGWISGVSGLVPALAAGDQVVLTDYTYIGDSSATPPPASGTSGGSSVAIDPMRPYYVTQYDAANSRIKISPNANLTNPFTAFSSSPTGGGLGVIYASCPVVGGADDGFQGSGYPDGYAGYHLACIKLGQVLGVAAAGDSAWIAAFESRLAASMATGVTSWAASPKNRLTATP